MSKKIAILATHGFEESELKSPKEHLEQQGWITHIVGLEAGTIKPGPIKIGDRNIP